jgi:hypothetical protein
MINANALMRINSLQYFSDFIEEVTRSSIPESYWEPLRSKRGSNGKAGRLENVLDNVCWRRRFRGFCRRGPSRPLLYSLGFSEFKHRSHVFPVSRP